MDNVYSGHWSTDCNRAKYITMANYLSLNRKNPVIEEHKIPNKTQPVHPCERAPSSHLYTSNISLKSLSIVAIPIAPIQPTATTMNHFCLSFITKNLTNTNQRYYYGKNSNDRIPGT